MRPTQAPVRMKIEDYFSANYLEARARFKALCEAHQQTRTPE